MSLSKPKTVVIVNAVVWAAMMLATSYLLADTAPDQVRTLILLFIAGWLTVHSVATKAQ